MRPGQSNYLTCNTRHPCKDDVGGVQCTSSLPVPSDLSEFQTQVPVFITVKLLHFNLHWFADLPAEPHPAQCPHRLPAHTPVLQGSFISFQHSCSTRFSSWLSQEQPPIEMSLLFGHSDRESLFPQAIISHLHCCHKRIQVTLPDTRV